MDRARQAPLDLTLVPGTPSHVRASGKVKVQFKQQGLPKDGRGQCAPKFERGDI